LDNPNKNKKDKKMNNTKVIYPTTPEYATDSRGNKLHLLYTEEQKLYPFVEERVLEIFKKYNINVDYKDDDTFADWLSINHSEGLFDNWATWEIRDVFLLQWMTDLRAGSTDIQYAVIKKEVFGRNPIGQP
jgi:hypothetical protein